MWDDMLQPMYLRRLAPLIVILGATMSSGAALSSAAGTPPAPEDFVPRWCSDGAPPPCLAMATRNGVPVTSSNPDWQVQQTARLDDIGYPYFQWQVVAVGSTPLSTSDTWSLAFDTGTLRPRYTEGYSGQPEVTRTDDGDGTWHVSYDASPVLKTTGCTSAYPSVCPHTADSWEVRLSGEVQQKPDGAFDGFDVGQSVDQVNG